jgi:hypothetical protein
VNRINTVLISGIYLADQENNIEHIMSQYGASANWNVVQRWAAIGNATYSQPVREVTVLTLEKGMPKFSLLNRLLADDDLERYDFIIVSDDDITLPPDFLDAYLDMVMKYDFALAQPARTHNSYIDHPFVERLDGLNARRTRFVEIGPVFSIRRDIFSSFLPFDERSSMGWGYDFVWPCLVEKMGLRMGIVDATPVEHSLRKPVRNYDYDDADSAMKKYLFGNPNLSKQEAFRILESYA